MSDVFQVFIVAGRDHTRRRHSFRAISGIFCLPLYEILLEKTFFTGPGNIGY